jgi:hypothetical protein
MGGGIVEALPEDVQEKKFAFLDIALFEEGAAIRGGCLVTDIQTHPLEFRVSGAIRPTSLQKILYGKTLHAYICKDLVGLPIIQALDIKPDFIFIRDAEFLKLRPEIDLPVLWIRTAANDQNVLQSYPGYDGEAEIAGDMLGRVLRGNQVMEPFTRIQTALGEAHILKLGE